MTMKEATPEQIVEFFTRESLTDIVERLCEPVMLHSNAEQTNAERREAAAEIARLRLEVYLLTISRREIMKIDEEHVAEIERLTAERANRYWEGRWRDEKAENERLTRDLEIWKRNGGDILLRAEVERLTPYVEAFRREEARADKAGAEIDRLTAERDGLRKLLDDKSYIRCKADYERGHLSHHNYLNAIETKALGAALKDNKP
jgi:hypothetical protein